jgi:hypothetical protein
MSADDRLAGGTDPPSGPGPRNRRIHRSDEITRRRGGRGTEDSTTHEEAEVPTGQAASPDVEGSLHTAPMPVATFPEPDARPGPPSATRTGSAGSAGSAEGPGPQPGEDWMDVARQQAEADSLRDPSSTTWSPGSGAGDVLEIDLTESASLVRPYARTGGRTRPVRDLDLEALVHTTLAGKEASTSPWLNPEHTSIIEMCSGTVSVAEIAARLAVPLGVARVIIADMVDLGLVEVMRTSAAEGDERDPDFLRRVLSGLQRL